MARKKKPENPFTVPEMAMLAERLIDLEVRAQEFAGGTPKFVVGDRVRILVQDPVALQHPQIIADPAVGATGTIKSVRNYPVYGVLIDGEEKLGLAGYNDAELEKVKDE